MRTVTALEIVRSTRPIVTMLALCISLTGCVVGPGLSLHVNEFMRPVNTSKLMGTARVASAGDVLVANAPLFEIDALVLSRPFEGKIPGSVGVNFNFKIDTCPMILSYQDEQWLYYVAGRGCASAWFNQTSVFSEEDHAGIRVSKRKQSDRQWFVDNSFYNSLPEHGYTRWNRRIRPEDEVSISTEPVMVGTDERETKWIRFDRSSPSVWHFTYFESNGTEATEREIQLSAKPESVLSVEGARLRIVGVSDEQVEFEVVSNFGGISASPQPEDGRSVGGGRSGTCFAVSSDGLILTAHHVVDGARNLMVVFEGASPQQATVVQRSPASDLALLRIDYSPPGFLPLAPARSTRLGQRVFTVGYPAVNLLGSQAKYSEGAISALSGIQGEATFLQISVPVQPGNSGGALIDEKGRVVGIVTSTAAVSGFLRSTGSLPQNVSWAVKSELAAALFDQPASRPRGLTREEVISNASKATCFIFGD